MFIQAHNLGINLPQSVLTILGIQEEQLTQKMDISCPLLKFSSKGDCVKLLQNKLKVEDSNKKLSIDGLFGKETLNAVKYFQTRNKILSDGIVGKVTWGMLDKNSPF